MSRHTTAPKWQLDSATARQWALYSVDTGLFTGRHIMCPEADIAQNTPAGCAALEGRYDRHTQRVDVATGAVVAYQRPQSEVDAEQRETRRRKAQRKIERLELAQHRPMRELQLDPNNATAKQRLDAIDAEIAGLRAVSERASPPRRQARRSRANHGSRDTGRLRGRPADAGHGRS